MKFCDFIIPHTVEESCGIRRQLGEAAQPIAGGTAFHFYTDDRIETAIDLSRLELNGITPGDGGLLIGWHGRRGVEKRIRARKQLRKLVRSDAFRKLGSHI